MKILIVSGFFYPIISPRSFRTTELVKELARLGHQVDVFVPRDDEPHTAFEEAFSNVRIYNLGKPLWKGLKPVKNATANLVVRSVNRIANLIFDLPQSSFYFLTRRALRDKMGYDLLISIAVPHSIHWGIASIWSSNAAKKIARTWVADCGDPFMYCDTDTFRKMPYFHYLENDFLRKANYITVPFADLKHYFNKKYRSKFRVIPQGFDFSEIDVSNYEPNTIPTFAFSGTVIPGIRDFFCLLDYLDSNYNQYKFHVFTKQKSLFTKYTANGNVILHEYKPRKKLIYELSKMDFLVNVETDYTDEIKNAIPSKLIDYTLAGRPILSFKNNHLPVNIIDEFMNFDFTNAYRGINIDQYDIRTVTDKFLELNV